MVVSMSTVPRGPFTRECAHTGPYRADLG
jgi:hypothetical protein